MDYRTGGTDPKSKRYKPGRTKLFRLYELVTPEQMIGERLTELASQHRTLRMRLFASLY